MAQLHEDAVRFLRQRLIALEDGRNDDAALILEYAQETYGLVNTVDIDPADFPAHVERFVSLGMPRSYGEGGRVVTVLVDYANTPVARIPDIDGSSPGLYETPTALLRDILPRPLVFAQVPNEELPENLRTLDVEIPGGVIEALRPYSPSVARVVSDEEQVPFSSDE